MDIVKFVCMELLYFIRVSRDLLIQKTEAIFKRNKSGL